MQKCLQNDSNINFLSLRFSWVLLRFLIRVSSLNNVLQMSTRLTKCTNRHLSGQTGCQQSSAHFFLPNSALHESTQKHKLISSIVKKKKKKKNDGPLTTNCTAVLPYVPPTAATSTRGFGCWAAQHTACYSALMNRQLWRQQGWLNVACSREGNWRWPQNQHGHTREGKTGYAKNMSDCSRISGSRKTTLLNPKNKEMCV